MNPIRYLRFLALTLLVFFALIPSAYSQIAVYLDDETGLPIAEDGGQLLFKSNYAFWENSWKWAAFPTDMEILSDTKYRSSGFNKQLNFELKSNAFRSQRKIDFEFKLLAGSSISGIIGGGIAFKLDKTAVKISQLKPVLLPHNSGWKWQGIEVRFSRPLASISFKDKSKSEIRAFFFKGVIEKGDHRVNMTVVLPESSQTAPNIAQRFGLTETSNWVVDKIGVHSFPIDLSFLNISEKPAGRKGFVTIDKDKLVFENGDTARFWGTNLTAATLFRTSKPNVRKQAKRLSKMGFNLVRLHHHDSPWVNPNIFGTSKAHDTKTLSRESLDKLDWWIKSLKDEGIYVWLDLHVQRYLKANDDIYAFDEIDKKNKRMRKGADLKGYNYVNLTIKNAMRKFNRDYVTHVNPYTGLAYKDEPAIIAMLLTNENDVTKHYGNKLLPNKNVPMHNKIYTSEAHGFARQHGLHAGRTLRSWEYGPSKLFLNDLEHQFNKELISELRELGVKVPIATTSTWGNNPLVSLPALTTGDIIDVHTYGVAL